MDIRSTARGHVWPVSVTTRPQEDSSAHTWTLDFWPQNGEDFGCRCVALCSSSPGDKHSTPMNAYDSGLRAMPLRPPNRCTNTFLPTESLVLTTGGPEPRAAASPTKGALAQQPWLEEGPVDPWTRVQFYAVGSSRLVKTFSATPVRDSVGVHCQHTCELKIPFADSQ